MSIIIKIYKLVQYSFSEYLIYYPFSLDFEQKIKYCSLFFFGLRKANALDVRCNKLAIIAINAKETQLLCEFSPKYFVSIIFLAFHRRAR